MQRQRANAVIPPRILVLEDNFLLAGHVCDFLRECGVEPVGPAPRLTTAAQVLKGQRIDAAILDINLGGQTCFPICAHLRRWNVPFLFLTGSDTSNIPAAFRDVPLLSKPFVPEELRQALAALLAQSPTRGNAAIDAALCSVVPKPQLHAAKLI
jgi:DNA-binding response OmpR family regulator